MPAMMKNAAGNVVLSGYPESTFKDKDAIEPHSQGIHIPNKALKYLTKATIYLIIIK